MPFIPHAADDVAAMLDTIGVASIEALFDEIPAPLQQCDLSAIEPGEPEMVVSRLAAERAAADGVPICFVGAGAYDHHIPAAVWDLVTRGEFYSAYTPYQAEASQGTLQLIYEFQSMIAALTALDVANASLYDGASALAEAVLMALRGNRSNRSRQVLLPRTLHPAYRATVATIVTPQQVELETIDYQRDSGTLDVAALAPYEANPPAALVVPQPNFFGQLEAVDQLTDWAHRHGVLLIAVVNPIALALLKPPGEWGEKGADIACGEGQPLGIPLASGGPYLGFISCREALLRQLPGRLVGRTVDRDGKPGFTLTLQAREQHIRRSRATSNICTNQGLLAAAATIYMALLGSDGLTAVARACHANRNALLTALTEIAQVEAPFSGAGFHEAVIRIGQPADQIIRSLAAQNLIGGYPLANDYPELGEDALLICATESRSAADISRYRDNLQRILERRGPACTRLRPADGL